MSEEFIKAEMALFAEQAKDVDIIITTALIPGKPAPKLITADMVASMKDGSVVVDLAAEQGGNCELTEPDELVVKHGVTHHRLHRPAEPPRRAVEPALRHQPAPPADRHDAGERRQDRRRHGRRGHPRCDDLQGWRNDLATAGAETVGGAAEEGAGPGARARRGKEIRRRAHHCCRRIGFLALLGLGAVAPPSFMAHFTVFVLACFVGYMVIWNVTPALHTPLMSVTNAISSIIVIGALLQVSSDVPVIKWIAVATLLITSINIAGGFAVTRRMLDMFRK